MPFTIFKRHPLLMPSLILALGLMLTFGFTAIWTGISIYNYERGWCALLGDIVSTGPAPARPPASWAHGTEVQKLSYHRWHVYLDLKNLQGAYRCR